MPQIGRYDVDRLLARGGMAEVYLGKAQGPAGFSKTVVIKRILPDLAEDPQFIEMFLSEARLAAELSHPNVVQVFDFGEHQGQYFLAMEYVQGETLRSIIRVHQKAKTPLPPELAVRAVIGVCEGLNYAHELCDPSGASRNIIHRDVTPDNVIVSAGGVPKLLDFGIAKANTAVHSTAAGTVKGKYAYMSPELIRGGTVGRQLDVYALGVTLYELLALKRPFEATTELGLMKVILETTAKPLKDAIGLDAALSKIVATAMHPAPEGRYADAHELQLALEDWLMTAGRKVGSAELAALVTEVTRLRGGGQGGPLEPRAKGTPVSGVRHSSDAKGKAPDFNGTKVVGAPGSARLPMGMIAGLGALGLVAAAGVAFLLGRSNPTPVVATVVERPADPPLGAVLPAPAEAPAAAVAPVAPLVKVAPVAPKEKPKAAEPKAVVAGEDGYLTLRTDPWCDVYLGSEKLGTTPLVRTPVASGKLTLVLRNAKAGVTKKLAVTVEPGKELKQALVMPQGSLAVDAAPGTEVALNGQVVGTTPMDPLDVVEGKHEVRLGGATRTVKVRAGQIETVR